MSGDLEQNFWVDFFLPFFLQSNFCVMHWLNSCSSPIILMLGNNRTAENRGNGITGTLKFTKAGNKAVSRAAFCLHGLLPCNKEISIPASSERKVEVVVWVSTFLYFIYVLRHNTFLSYFLETPGHAVISSINIRTDSLYIMQCI